MYRGQPESPDRKPVLTRYLISNHPQIVVSPFTADEHWYPLGEIAATTNCTAVLTDPHGRFRLTASEAQAAFVDLTLYTNAESCPMVRRLSPMLRVLRHIGRC